MRLSLMLSLIGGTVKDDGAFTIHRAGEGVERMLTLLVLRLVIE